MWLATDMTLVTAATKTDERGEMKKVLEDYPDFKYEKISNRQ